MRPTTTSAIPSPLQNLVDIEMEAVQEAILKAALASHPHRGASGSHQDEDYLATAVKHSGLPLSIMRSVLGGENYPLPLHAILSAVDDEPRGVLTDEYAASSDNIAVSAVGGLKREFVDNIHRMIDSSSGKKCFPSISSPLAVCLAFLLLLCS
jgi:hypothetical protein